MKPELLHSDRIKVSSDLPLLQKSVLDFLVAGPMIHSVMSCEPDVNRKICVDQNSTMFVQFKIAIWGPALEDFGSHNLYIK